MSIDWPTLLRGELLMTCNIAVGLVLGDALMRFGLIDRVMRRFMPILARMGIGPILGSALAVSVGSSKAGAAILASALEEGRITREGALWGTISLSFPAYLRRWPSTCVLCLSMTGRAGAIFAATLLLRSLGRFIVVVLRTRGTEALCHADTHDTRGRGAGWVWHKRLLKTLPVAWIFYAAAFTLMPLLDGYMRAHLGGSVLPLAGWGVASAALAGISASLALARGALAASDLDVAQTVFALLLGNGLGYFTRALRQNAGYFFGIFPAGLSKSILIWNIATMLPFTLVSIAISLLFIL